MHVKAYSGALKAVEHQVFPLFPEAATACLEDWRQVSKSMDVDIQAEVLESTPRLVERILSNFARESRRTQWQEMMAVKEVIGSMGRAMEQMQAGQSGHKGRIDSLSDTLDAVASVEDPAGMREQLSRLALELKDCARQLADETSTVLGAMEREIASFRSRLVAAEEAASTDPLTGLANRREFDRVICDAVARDQQFSLLLFDLDEFKSFNDRFGHATGDAVLRRFSSVLAEQVRPSDLVARWGGDEFIILLHCPLHEAMRRTRQISDVLSRAQSIAHQGRTLQLRLQSSVGVAQRQQGESAAEVFHRVDQAMYASKCATKDLAAARRAALEVDTEPSLALAQDSAPKVGLPPNS